MDWFTNDPNTVFDMELQSDFIPVEKVVFHKKVGITELCRA